MTHSASASGLRAGVLRVMAGLPVALCAAMAAAQPGLPPPPVPPENPITEQKRVLGKILFFDEQVSMSNTVACATCHVAARGGSDPRRARNPGPDGVLNTPDDKIASPGVIHSDVNNDYVRDAVFGLAPQITGRAANSPIDAVYGPQLFWDGRASNQFIDPQTGQVAIVGGGSLESQCVNPPVSSAEMGHESVTWTEIATKLARVQPLDLATNIPPDVAAVLAARPSYPELFRQAFGDPAITARRIAFALGTFERTLIANQTPWDLGTLTPGQLSGQQTFQNICGVCHTPPIFSNEQFRNIGIRPVAEDLGRQIVTGNTADRGRFKVPSLRNAGLKNSYMHNGQFTQLNQVIDFYARVNGAPPPNLDNLDPAFPPPNFPNRANLDDFVRNGLTDPRVANQTFPFDRATLFSERLNQQPVLLPGGTAGTGGTVPRIIAQGPAMVGNLDYRVGLDGALGNATAQLGFSLTPPPPGGPITPERFVGTIIAAGAGPGLGLGTLHWPLTTNEVSSGQVVFLQWFVTDAGATGGQALSNVAQVTVFCGSSGCPAPCGYANCDGSTTPPVLNINDFSCFLNRFATGDVYANCDQSTTPPVLNVLDFACFMNTYAKGCP